MKTRKQAYGNKNIIGKRTEELRKQKGISQKDMVAQIQVAGIDINPTSYSKLEGQLRSATDKEVLAIAQVLQTDISELFMKK